MKAKHQEELNQQRTRYEAQLKLQTDKIKELEVSVGSYLPLINDMKISRRSAEHQWATTIQTKRINCNKKNKKLQHCAMK